jgi:hypothetical protein
MYDHFDELTPEQAVEIVRFASEVKSWAQFFTWLLTFQKSPRAPKLGAFDVEQADPS